MTNQAYTIDEFCQAHRICRAHFYNLLKNGTGPRIMKVGSRTLVSVEAATDWRLKLEDETGRRSAAAVA
jgi:hypothetical protein